uniref:C2 domain-containing protein n=1 Tax=Schistosoma mansoni TaxID=6183 RepID=A0A5K4FBQ3_SCHMA
MNITMNRPNLNQTSPLKNNSLPQNSFLLNLTKTFHVSNISLAIFILVIICILCLTFIILTILCIRTFIRKKYMPKKYKKKEKPIYVNDIPGLMKPNNELHNNNGTIEYSLSYNIKEEQLKICIIQANNLIIPNDKQEPLNAYATISLMKYDNNTQLNNPSNILDPNLDPNLNDKHLKLIGKQYRTDIIHHSNKPCWNQSFIYKLKKNQLKYIIIIIEIFNYNDQYLDTNLGKLFILLNQLDHSDYAGKFFEKTDWLLINHSINNNPNYHNHILGEICIGLIYDPNHLNINLYIYEIRNLNLNQYFNDTTTNDDNEDTTYKQKWKFSSIELNIVTYIKYNDRLLQKYKTQSRKELINPYFNEKFCFKIKEKYLKNLLIIIQLRQVEKWRYRRIVGEVCIGQDVFQLKSIKHWDELLKFPDKLHVRWHPIYAIPIKQNSFLLDWLCFDPL